jgi:hypothetical protein
VPIVFARPRQAQPAASSIHNPHVCAERSFNCSERSFRPIFSLTLVRVFAIFSSFFPSAHIKLDTKARRTKRLPTQIQPRELRLFPPNPQRKLFLPHLGSLRTHVAGCYMLRWKLFFSSPPDVDVDYNRAKSFSKSDRE